MTTNLRPCGTRSRLVGLLALAFLVPATLVARPVGSAPAADVDEEAALDDAAPAEVRPGQIDLKLLLLNLFLWRNDSDFDRTAALYQPDGQSMGVLGTFLMPDVTFHVLPNLRLFYELEIGLNLWSLHNPDQQDPTARDMFLMKHRELYAEGEFFDGWLGFKIGYQRFQDPSRLFLDNWIGAASLSSDLRVFTLTATVGQMPDPTYEGFKVEENNFEHDLFVYSLVGRRTFPQGLSVSFGVFGMNDARIVGRTARLWTPVANVEADLGFARLGLDGAAQVGTFEHAERGGGDQLHLAWAAQLYGQADLGKLFVKLNVLALSGDDADPDNGANGAFYYSAKNRSSTIFFTESEVRDTFDNLDEKMSVNRGGYFLPRAGFGLADVQVSYDVWEGLRPTLILGYAFALNPDNALGSRNLGAEIDLGLTFAWRGVLEVQAYGGVLVPGKGLAANVNRIDLAATEPIFTATTALKVFY